MANDYRNLFSSSKAYDSLETDLENPGNTLPGKRLARNIYGFAGKPTLPNPIKYTLRWQTVGQNTYPFMLGSNLFNIDYAMFISGGEDSNGNITNQIYIYHTHHRLGNRKWEGLYPFVGKPLDYEFHEFGTLPIAVKDHLLFTFRNRLYLIGGVDTNGNTLSSVYSSPVPGKVVSSIRTYNQELETQYSGDLLNWEQETDFPFPISKTQAIVIGNRLYILAGLANNSPFYSIYTPEWYSYHPTSWMIAGGIPNNLTDIHIATKPDIHSAFIVGNDLVTNSGYPLYQLQFSQTEAKCDGVYYLGNTNRQLSNYNLSYIDNNIFLLGNYIYDTQTHLENKNQIYVMRQIDDPTITWEFYHDLPNNLVFNKIIVMHNTYYLLCTNTTTNEELIVEVRLVVYGRGNKIYDY